MINYTMPLVASRVMVENAPDRLVIREDRWGGHTVADLGEYTAEKHALGALFAAAPDMYEALEAAIATLTACRDAECSVYVDDTVDVLDAALAKAEGR